MMKTFSEIAPRGERNAPSKPVCGAGTAQGDTDSGERGLLRPGYEVLVDAHGSDAVVVKSPTRMKPGTRTDLQLLGQRRILHGEIARCRISRLEPLCYEAIFIFHQSVEMPETEHV